MILALVCIHRYRSFYSLCFDFLIEERHAKLDHIHPPSIPLCHICLMDFNCLYGSSRFPETPSLSLSMWRNI